MKEMTLDEIQSVSLKILKYIHELCEKNGIKYWLIYGTLLGAIRHKGYIPWDDDVDIAMTRDDYEKFLKIAVEESKKDENPYYVDHFTVSKDYPYYIMRICDSRYRLEFESTRHTSGIFVDIYPFDDTGNDVNYWIKKSPHTELMKKCMLLSTYYNWFYGSSVLHKILNLPLMIYSRVMGTQFFMKRIDKMSRIFNGENSGFIGLTSWADVLRIYPKEWFKELKLVQFENLNVYIPACYDEVLKIRYGDYMTLPPESEQVPHHNYKAYEIERS